MHIGLIGGIGPAATVAYYERLTSAVRAAGGRLELTIVQADLPTLIANGRAHDRIAQAREYAGTSGNFALPERSAPPSPRSAVTSASPSHVALLADLALDRVALPG
jgi:hypothetical protein